MYSLDRNVTRPLKWRARIAHDRREVSGTLGTAERLECCPRKERSPGVGPGPPPCREEQGQTEPSSAKQDWPGHPPHRRSEHRGTPRAQQRTLNYLPIRCPKLLHDRWLPSLPTEPTCSLRIILNRTFWKPPQHLQMALSSP